ncbi:MAG: hypothetical protein WBR24_13715 [Desulfobacterales bacterium]
MIESAETCSAETLGKEAIEGSEDPVVQQMPEYDRAGIFAGQGFALG